MPGDAAFIKRAAVVLNPNAGSWKRLPDCDSSEGRARTVRSWFANVPGIELAVIETRCPGDGSACATEAIHSGHDTIIAAGGDGTVREVISGLYMAKSGKLGILPLGTANVLARALKIPLGNPDAAARVIGADVSRCIDLGLCNGAVFVLHAGIGLDGLVVHRIDPSAKRRFGRAAYVITSAIAALYMPARRVRIVPNGNEAHAQEYRAYQVFAANISEYGGDLRLADSVDPSDGLLDIFVCRHRWITFVSALLDGVSLVTGRLANSRAVEYLQVRSVLIESYPPSYVQLDGDGVGHSPVQIDIAPGALRVLVSNQSKGAAVGVFSGAR